MRLGAIRAVLLTVAAGELVWSLLSYFRPDLATGMLGRSVLDPVMARQYPLYLASVALAYALGAANVRRYPGIVTICLVQRALEIVVAAIDRLTGSLGPASFAGLVALELVVTAALLVARKRPARPVERSPADPRDRGLVRLLRAFGALELFWFFASTVFVQLGARLLGWPLQDPYVTQQQGIALAIIGLVSLLAATDVARYRVFVWVPIASQLIGMANALNEVRIGTIPLGEAGVQWAIQALIAGAFFYFSRNHRSNQPTRRRATSI